MIIIAAMGALSAVVLAQLVAWRVRRRREAKRAGMLDFLFLSRSR